LTESGSEREAERLEHMWAGEFGSEYSSRNLEAGGGRGDFWRRMIAATGAAQVLEVGCNTGSNLRWLAELIEPSAVFGVDVNDGALEHVRRVLPGVTVVSASVRRLPFPDRSFDLVFTTGVLIHVPPQALSSAMTEIVRCARRFVLCGEYYAPEPAEVPYRGQNGALFKRDYGALYEELFPELELVERGFLGRDEGWDDVTWWLFRRP